MHPLDAVLGVVEGVALDSAAAVAAAPVMVVGAGRRNCSAMVANTLDEVVEAGIGGGTGTVPGARAGRGSGAVELVGSGSTDDGRDVDGRPVVSSLP